MKVTRGAFPGSVAMRMRQVKRCLSISTPVRALRIECDCEEDADLLFAGVSILSLGNESKKMADTRRTMKEKHLEDELAREFQPSAQQTAPASSSTYNRPMHRQPGGEEGQVAFTPPEQEASI